MFDEIKVQVLEANLKLVEYGLVVLTWGNASQITPDGKYVIIKPSGVSYSTMKSEDMVVVDMDGNVIEGSLRPSSDLPTHLELYKAFPKIGGVVHTHSTHAVGLAQAEIDLPCFNTTHADSFCGAIPCTRHLSENEIKEAYEKNTGLVIAETFSNRQVDYNAVPGVVVCKHGPFTWGRNALKAAENALVLEETAKMYFIAKVFNPDAFPAPQYLLDKHYFRKHGANAYYGQK